MLNNSISISVSDDDSEDSSSRLRSRIRHKRKKPFMRGRPALTRKIISKLFKWWPALLLILAVTLLVYEAVKIGGGERRSPPPIKKSESAYSRSSGFKPQENLNRLDPTTRVVAGVRERCLKLLPPEELELLEIPNDEDSRSPVKDLVYAMETDRPSKEEKFNLSMIYLEGARFNLFTGNQTLEEREQSFKVTERAEVHCGFFCERGGFWISDEDQSYMKTCKVVVSTCAFGGGDDLYQPIGMSETSLQKVCYVAFWDEVTLATQEAEGNKVDDSRFIGKWRIIIVRDLPFRDQRLNGKIPKMLPHRLFPNARYSIWVDSKSQFRRDPLGVLEALLWRSDHELAISEHGARSNVYDEAKAVVKKNKATPEEVEVQLTQYRQDGLPEDKRFNGKKALAEASIIVRKHTPLTNLFMCLWFNEVLGSLIWPSFVFMIEVLQKPASRKITTVLQIGLHFVVLAITVGGYAAPYAAAPPDVGALIFHRMLTEGPENTSRVVGKAQGFIIPVESFAHSDFNIIYLTFHENEYSGSVSILAKNINGHREKEELTVVGGTGSFAFARGLAVFVQTDGEKSNLDANYYIKLQLKFPNR
ncbi:hypothetical protein CASFOL_021288 [Castilleja foliolosa]|uniref:Dirigent protein n=1 Tax=Castilleja foliolosa TaxID=1961234 RepID=A0ABD3CYS4_9LAMI